ncbi:MAG: WhiB family transcriptional regulator, redox-sensing transcriptional regulator [Pseudonocardiales bacterium]|jgi:WhiB family redox-sensing transcriptional regulator|nr:whiB1 [Pseudonocardia sp.]MDT7649190.1 WhiB family transcriptional regulator, redox-sensing transcriptional regulator [Pseudonocardiales bacterium]
MNWRHQAACRTVEPELFFPIGTSGPALGQLAQAKSVCRACPVLNECLAWALESGQNSGVWGGMSEDERRRLQQDRSGHGVRQRSHRLAGQAPSASIRGGGVQLPPRPCR